MAKVTYNDLVGLVDADFALHDPVGKEVDYILDAARINADDTMREGTDQTWEAIALSTIESQLAYCKDEAVVAWFVNNGVKF